MGVLIPTILIPTLGVKHMGVLIPLVLIPLIPLSTTSRAIAVICYSLQHEGLDILHGC